MNYPVAPAGEAKTAIAELQGKKKLVVSGAAANTGIPLAGVKPDAFLFSVIGIDAAQGTQANKVLDMTTTCALSAITLTPSAIAKSTTLPLVVTANGHGLVDGDHVSFGADVGGMIELRNTSWVVDRVDANNFKLVDSNSSKFTAFTSGGTITTKRAQLKNTNACSSYQLIVEVYAKP